MRNSCTTIMMVFTFTSFVALGARHLRLLDYLEGSWLRASPIPLGNDHPSSLTLFDSSFTPPRRSTKKSSIQSKRYHKDNVCTSVLCGTCTGITHSLIKFKINFWWTKLTQMECGTNSAVHRPKPGQNLVIRAGFLFYFIFLHRVGNGLSIFAPRPGPGSSGAKKNRNPGTDP